MEMRNEKRAVEGDDRGREGVKCKREKLWPHYSFLFLSSFLFLNLYFARIKNTQEAELSLPRVLFIYLFFPPRPYLIF